ncbi:MAG TPA: hypothetical protein VIF37_13505 [Methylobacter sp.]|jgi:hypothetical protein
MDVDEVQRPGIVQLDLRIQDRPLSSNGLGYRILRFGSHFLVARSDGEIMQVFVMFGNFETAQNDQIALVIDLQAFFG